MQSTDWPLAHSEALREFFAGGMSYSQSARAINAKFKTAYSRNAALGRARRMGLASRRRQNLPKTSLTISAPRRHKISEGCEARSKPRARPPEAAQPIKLRRVEIDPRHLSLTELERGDCRYPYGGDAEGEAITFCGHPKRQGSSYCVAHFHLTRGPGTASERAAGAVLLRLVKRRTPTQGRPVEDDTITDSNFIMTETSRHGTTETKQTATSGKGS
jgi:GcrA cell cycle regulator